MCMRKIKQKTHRRIYIYICIYSYSAININAECVCGFFFMDFEQNLPFYYINIFQKKLRCAFYDFFYIATSKKYVYVCALYLQITTLKIYNYLYDYIMSRLGQYYYNVDCSNQNLIFLKKV